MADHMIKPNAYTEMYGAPHPHADREGFERWIAENRDRYGPTPLEWHEEDCPGCAAEG